MAWGWKSGGRKKGTPNKPVDLVDWDLFGRKANKTSKNVNIVKTGHARILINEDLRKWLVKEMRANGLTLSGTINAALRFAKNKTEKPKRKLKPKNK